VSDDVSGLGGTIFVSMLQVLFIGLKLSHVIEWSWWWVLSPMLISWTFGLIMFVILFTFFINWRDMLSQLRKSKL